MHSSRESILALMRTNTSIPEDEVRALLARILASRSFEGVERLRKFLEFVVLETLAGRGEQIKEFAVGEYAFGKGASFDPRNDPIVRVQARRLRARLERYQQSEGEDDTVLIDLPKGKYVPAFRRRDAAPARPAVLPILLDRSSILVKPFEDQVGDAESKQICRGLSQGLIHALVGLPDLTVYADAAGLQSTVEIDDLLPPTRHAATVLRGQVQRRGQHYRISSQLIDTASLSYQFAEVVEGLQRADSFELQDQVVQAITSRVREGMTPRGWRDKTAGVARNLAAQNLYLQGRYQLDQRTEESLRLAAGLFEKAIDEDTQFAQAHAGLADAYELMGHYGVIAPVEVWARAPSSATTAVLLDDRCVEAHTALAHVRSTQDWNWIASEQEFRRALELDPRSATAHHWYATSCLAPMGRLDEALQAMHAARTLAPLSSIIARDVASLHYYRREFEAALEQCDQAIELNPYFSQAYWTLGFIQEQRHDYPEAMAAFSRAVELAPGSPRNKGALGRMLALEGNHKGAHVILKELETIAGRRYVSPLLFASLYLALNNQQVGYEWLERAFQDRCFELMLVHVDPRFDAFRTDPNFVRLASQLNLPASAAA